MPILVIAEHDNRNLQAATLHAIAAAGRLGADVHLLVAGSGCAGVAEQAARVDGLARVLVADAPHHGDQTAENLAALVVSLAASGSHGSPGGSPSWSHILAPATTFGRNFLPRVAALLGVAQVSDVVAIEGGDTFVRPIYAGNAIATVRSLDPVRVLTVRITAFEAAASGGAVVPVEAVAAGPDLGLARLVSREVVPSARPDLGAARVVVAGGRGVGSAENFRQLLEPLADRLDAALGASRAAPNDWQVGQTGRIVAPDLYIAVGISGAIQHLAGMREAKVIVAINKDPDAPIFQVADYGLVADLFEAVPALTAALQPS